MTLRDLAREAVKAAEMVKANESLLLPSLALRASRAAEQFPFDTPILTASQVLNRMAETEPFITRAAFTSLCDKLHSTTTKLGEVFADEIDRENILKGPQVMDHSGEEGIGTLDDFKYVADPMLSNALAAAFDGSDEYKPYSAEIGRKAERACNAGLIEIGLAPKKISVFAGQEDLILCQASYETPKGSTSVVIPIEIKEGSALFPTMFLGQDSFIDLQAPMLTQHIVSTAGKSFLADGEGLLKVLSTAKNGVKKVASGIEMAVIRLRSEKYGSDNNTFDANGIIGLKVAEASEFVQDPQAEMSPEHFEFADRVTSPDGAARFIHSNRVVEAGRDIIIRKMTQFGYPNVQVKVANVSEREIDYAIGVGVNSAMLTQIKVVGNNVFPPNIAIASGKVKAFSQAGIKELVEDTSPDTRMLAASSMSAGLKPSELVQQVREAVAEGNLIKAEDAINVLGEVDKQAQKIAVAVLMQSLSDPMGSEGSEVGDKSADIMAGVSSNRMVQLANTKVRDVPVFNSYNVFFPED